MKKKLTTSSARNEDEGRRGGTNEKPDGAATAQNSKRALSKFLLLNFCDELTSKEFTSKKRTQPSGKRNESASSARGKGVMF